MVISASNLSKTVAVGESSEKLTILHDISLTASAGEFLSIVGPSGSGKSTLLHCLSGLLRPTTGNVQILDVDPYHLSSSKAAAFRRNHIGFIFQSYNLIPALPAYENIVLPLRLSRTPIDRHQIEQLLKKLNFNANPNNQVTDLSGGEQQKVAIARVLVAKSQIIFADEPTGALDSVSRQIIFNLLRELTNNGVCVIMVTHDIEMAAKTDKSLTLRDGHLEKILDHPNAETIFAALNTEKS